MPQPGERVTFRADGLRDAFGPLYEVLTPTDVVEGFEALDGATATVIEPDGGLWIVEFEGVDEANPALSKSSLNKDGGARAAVPVPSIE